MDFMSQLLDAIGPTDRLVKNTNVRRLLDERLEKILSNLDDYPDGYSIVDFRIEGRKLLVEISTYSAVLDVKQD